MNKRLKSYPTKSIVWITHYLKKEKKKEKEKKRDYKSQSKE